MALSLPLLLGSAALAPLQAPPQFAPEMLPAAQVAEAMRQITAAPNTFIVVDGNNVRGRVGFRLGKGELSALLVTWAERHQLSEQVVVAWDHGQRSEALVWRGVCHGADALRLEHRAAVESAPSQRLTHPRLWRSLRGAPTICRRRALRSARTE